jgi:lipopolysaccharide/colanic/teichoic acid biosynthesis glycosyltransferase
MSTSNIAVPNLGLSDESLGKRAMDVAASLLFLTILGPFFLLVAGLIKLDSRGPVLFRQKRIGKDGEPFYIWKFRTMRAGTHPYRRSPASNGDVRLTKVGRILRRLSIDELPQLVNVLKGEMSLVGPRPEMPFIVKTYGSFECQRLCVKPGITGLWQISPARAMPIHQNLEYDLFYIRNRTLLLDCAILLRTVTAVVKGVGAT